jgi:hypothetical protein
MPENVAHVEAPSAPKYDPIEVEKYWRSEALNAISFEIDNQVKRNTIFGWNPWVTAVAFAATAWTLLTLQKLSEARLLPIVLATTAGFMVGDMLWWAMRLGDTPAFEGFRPRRFDRLKYQFAAQRPQLMLQILKNIVLGGVYVYHFSVLPWWLTLPVLFYVLLITIFCVTGLVATFLKWHARTDKRGLDAIPEGKKKWALVTLAVPLYCMAAILLRLILTGDITQLEAQVTGLLLAMTLLFTLLVQQSGHQDALTRLVDLRREVMYDLTWGREALKQSERIVRGLDTRKLLEIEERRVIDQHNDRHQMVEKLLATCKAMEARWGGNESLPDTDRVLVNGLLHSAVSDLTEYDSRTRRYEETYAQFKRDMDIVGRQGGEAGTILMEMTRLEQADQAMRQEVESIRSRLRGISDKTNAMAAASAP